MALEVTEYKMNYVLLGLPTLITLCLLCISPPDLFSHAKQGCRNRSDRSGRCLTNISEKVTNDWKSVILSITALLKWLYLPDQSKMLLTSLPYTDHDGYSISL